MTSYLSIGDFSRATHMTVKTLRHYHEIGLLEPVDVDPQTGYRRYSAEQIPTAQVVRRFRDLGMPLEEIRTVLATSDVATRNQHISAHLHRLEQELGRTQRAVAALRDLLSPPAAPDSPAIELRSVGTVQAAAVTATVEAQDAGAWFQGALGELFATVAGQGLEETSHAGGVYADELFTLHRGQCTVFVPCDPPRPAGRPGHPAAGARRGTRRDRALRATRRGRPRLRHAGCLRRTPRARRRRPDPRVLPGRPASHPGQHTVANRSLLAGLPYRRGRPAGSMTRPCSERAAKSSRFWI